MNLAPGSSWHSYPKVYGFGHKCVASVFDGSFTVQEKIDGSQFSFGKFDGEVKVRSRGKVFPIEAPEKMFQEACDTVMGLTDILRDGWTYRGEYLKSPSHNTLHYDRIPRNHIMLFDVETSLCDFLSPEELEKEGDRLGLEVVPRFPVAYIRSVADIETLMEQDSVLGGQKIEGIVVKNYERFAPDGKVLMAKHVSEAFKEIHNTSWKAKHPGQNDIIFRLIDRYRTPARWQKAVQHLAEAGTLLGEPKDIGPLMKEVGTDVFAECQEEVREILFKWAWPKISRGITGGLPEWYKGELLKKQFGEEDE
jgi:hypothetical protein